MPESFEQYKQRLLRYLGTEDPLRVQSRTLAAIEKLVKGATPAKLKKQPAPGKWSVAQILAHLADNELVRSYRIRSILGAPGTPLQAYDQDRWAESQRYDLRAPKASLVLLRSLREADLALLKSLRPQQWKLAGVHAERGLESIETLVRIGAGHDINHLRQIESILKPNPSSAKARR